MARLGWPAGQQVDYLKNLGAGGSVDELALEFDDVYGLVANLALDGDLSVRESSILAEIDVILQRISRVEHRHLWTEGALADAEEWREIRRMREMPPIDDLERLRLAIREELAAQHAIGRPDVDDEWLDSLAEMLVAHINYGFDVRWAPKWVRSGAPPLMDRR